MPAFFINALSDLSLFLYIPNTHFSVFPYTLKLVLTPLSFRLLFQLFSSKLFHPWRFRSKTTSQSKKNQYGMELETHRTLVSPSSAALEISSAMMTKKRYRISVILTAITLGLLLLLSGASFCVRVECHRRFLTVIGDFVAAGNNNIVGIYHRKLLVPETVKQPDRIWGEKRCSKSDLLIYQGPTDPLPNGIPTYTVEIMNACITKDCHISHIHLNCGWFSSARLIDPRVFKRLSFDNCLVNNGKPLINGDSISFQYANTFPYHLSISSIHC